MSYRSRPHKSRNKSRKSGLKATFTAWWTSFTWRLGKIGPGVKKAIKRFAKPAGKKISSARELLLDVSEQKVANEKGDLEIRDMPELKSFLDPIFCLRELFTFVKRWLKSRPWKTLLQAVPAFLVGIVVPYAFVVFGQSSTEERISEYRASVIRLMNLEEYEEAKILLREIIELDPQNAQHVFLQGTLAELSGDSNRAVRIMSHLAHDWNYAQAHRWLASYHWRLANSGRVESFDSVRHHTQAILKTQRTDREAHRMLGATFLKTGNTEQAIQHLQIVADKDPVARLRIAEAYFKRGNRVQARKHALLGLELVQEAMQIDPQNLTHVLQAASGYKFAGEEDRGLQLLEDAWQTSKDARIRVAISDLCFAWSDRLLEAPRLERATFAQSLELLKRALSANPQSLKVADRLAKLSLKLGDDDEQLGQFLNEALENGVAPAIVHFMNGTRALLKDDTSAAEFHLQQALQADANTPGVLNNIAMTILLSAESEPQRLQEALRLVDRAIKMTPAHPYFHDTRGQVLLKLERYTESIQAFEAALKSKELRSAVYPHLAVAYRQLGQVKQADRFLELAGQEK